MSRPTRAPCHDRRVDAAQETGERIRPSKRLVLQALVLPIVAAALLVVGYFTVLPLDGTDEDLNIAVLVFWLLVVGLVIVVQTRQIMDADFPVLRGIGVLAIVIPAYLVGFAIAYYLMAAHTPATFGGPLTRMAALYFTVTVFATVGFGDIHAQDDVAMAVVTVQMILNLLLLAVGVRAVVTAARVGRERRGGRVG